MGKLHRPRHGSLQYWPRKRAAKDLPSVNWEGLAERNIQGKNKLLGFIGYKAGMVSLLAKDLGVNSMTKGKNIVIPGTVIECPPIKIMAVRFYKGSVVAFDVLAPSLDKELKRKIKMPKKATDMASAEKRMNEFTDLKLVVYSTVHKTGIQKTPDIIEMGLSGNLKDKLEFAKNSLGKEINVDDIFNNGQLLDVHAVTKGKGTVGPVKRFGLGLKGHKSEKGVRRPGSLGPWHPARVTFKAPQMGQMGMFTRVQYNNRIMGLGKEWAKMKGAKDKITFPHFGEIKNPFCIIKGSAAGPQKRAIMLTYAMRPTTYAAKENFEVLEVI